MDRFQLLSNGHLFVTRLSVAAEWLRTTDEVMSSWKNISYLEAGTTYEVRVIATNGGQRRASHVKDVKTGGIGECWSLWYCVMGVCIATVTVVMVTMWRGISCSFFSARTAFLDCPY